MMPGSESKKGWIKYVVAAVIIAGAAGWYFWSKRKPEIQWRTAAVERGPIQVSVTSTGTLQALVTVQVGTQVSGTISALYADFNSHVRKGQIIASLDSTLLRATLTDALSSMEKAAAQERQASDELKRTKALFDRALVSQSDLDQSTANARVAAANLSSAKAQVDRARINLHYATIVSPIDGIVLSRAVDVGQTVAASFNTPTLFTIAGDLSQMQVHASVDEADIGKIRIGQHATFTVDAYPDTIFQGQVQQIRLQPITVQNVVTYEVVIGVPNPNLKLMPGMTASLTVAVARKEDVLIVPAAALRFNPWAELGGGDRKKAGGWKKPDSAGGASGRGGQGTVGGTGMTGAGAGGGASTGAAGGDTGARDSSGNVTGNHGGHGDWKHGGDSSRESSNAGAGGTGSAGESKGLGGYGRVFVLENGKPKAIPVQTGLTDGTHTEISNVKPGAQVLVGVESAQEKSSNQAAPFGMPRGGRGGHFH